MQERIGGGYGRGQRFVETAAVVAFFAGELILVGQLFQAKFEAWLIPVGIAAVIAGAFIADLVSGVVHWACDTWGTLETPVLGNIFIRQFREHHLDPQEIDRHDLIETNGTNAGLALVPLTVSWTLVDLDELTIFSFAFYVTGLSLALFVVLTSQAHRWAHAVSVPSWVRILQRVRLVLSPEHHAIHHRAPHRHHYCITGGWLDAGLERYRVFRHAESLITRVTGAQMHIDEVAEIPKTEL